MDENKALTIITCSFFAGLTVIFTSLIFCSYYNESLMIEKGYSQEITERGLIWVKK